jgi:pyrroline-5-carboxylate reductase
MGEAIASGIIAAGSIPAECIAIAEPSETRRELFAARGMRAAADAREVTGDAEMVLLAVKPQVIDVVLTQFADSIAPGTLVVSIAAGITTGRLEQILPAGTPVVRVMPNTPAMVGAGMAVVSGGAAATGEHVERVRQLFEAVGSAVVLDEDAQDAATAISGSGPAYVALFIDALADAGAAQGLTRDVALQLAIQTFKGTAQLLVTSGMAPQELIDGVSSPGGTTVAALGALEAAGVRAAIDAAVTAAVKRAKELGS